MPRCVRCEYRRDPCRRPTKETTRDGREFWLYTTHRRQDTRVVTRAAKTIQRIACNIIAACDGYFLDGLGHVGDSNRDEAIGNAASGLRPTLFGHRGKCLAHTKTIKRRIAFRAKYFRGKVRLQLACHYICVGHSERAAVAMGHRPGLRARRIPGRREACSIEMKD